jgi:pimeloyl-ACP methyl ester carboxylesterase
VREWGDEDAPATLLWPGLGFTGIYFAELAAHLPHGVAIDPPGHGESADRSWEDYALPKLAELVHELLEATRGDTFVGHSWGGTVGAAAAFANPAALRALVLVDGGFIPGEARLDFGLPVGDDRDSLLAFAREAMSEHESWAEAFAELREVAGGNWPPHGEAIGREVFAEVDGRVREHASATGAAAVFDALGSHDARACAERIRDADLPTLLIVGGRTPYLEAKRRAWERFAAEGAPAVELHVDLETGHHPLLEAPDEYLPLIARWLRARG